VALLKCFRIICKARIKARIKARAFSRMYLFCETVAIDLAIASSSTSEVINDFFQCFYYYSIWNEL
jgi:hypothetical protein